MQSVHIMWCFTTCPYYVVLYIQSVRTVYYAKWCAGRAGMASLLTRLRP